MEDDLPTNYDVVVIGTGMTESIVAAAASRVGKRVLHLDSNEYYGSLWASFNFDSLQKLINDYKNPSAEKDSKSEAADEYSGLIKEGEVIIRSGNHSMGLSNVDDKWYIPDEPLIEEASQQESRNTQTENSGDADNDKDKQKAEAAGDAGFKIEVKVIKLWKQQNVKNEYRKFNLDLAPKLLFSRGSLVELLISSNIARYAEFRSVSRVLTWLDGKLEAVPCSRADVFATKHVSVVEKRMLMKLLTTCTENSETNHFEGFEDKTFLEFLESKKLTPNLIHFVLYAIAMGTNDLPCMEGVSRTQRFLNSLGRYGNTPFLWPMYGSGELPQCFCRLCAVFGGLYHLKRAADALIVSSGEGSDAQCLGILSAGKRLDANYLVMGIGYSPSQFINSTACEKGLSRAIFVTDRSILPAEKESLTILQFPPVDGIKIPVTVIEVGPSTHACPQGLYVVHMICRQHDNARTDIAAVAEKLLRVEFSDGIISTDTQSTQTPVTDEPPETDLGSGESNPVNSPKPQVLWSLHFNMRDTSDADLVNTVPKNVFLCSGPDLDLDFEFSISQAKEIFSKMYPDEEFLPRAPDPEEIVLDDDDEDTSPGAEDKVKEANEE